jgi:hypothetical protein
MVSAQSLQACGTLAVGWAQAGSELDAQALNEPDNPLDAPLVSRGYLF